MKNIKALLVTMLLWNVVAFLTLHFIFTIAKLLEYNNILVDKLYQYAIYADTSYISFFGLQYSDIMWIYDILLYIIIFSDMFIITVVLFLDRKY